MPHVTKQLGNEAGIQYQGVTDASSSVSQFPVNGVIVGQFRRGRYDKPMTVNLRNIRALLGHDPKNIDYLNVLEALKDGVPSVQVLRISGGAVDLNGFCLEWTFQSFRYFAAHRLINSDDFGSIFQDSLEVKINGQPFGGSIAWQSINDEFAEFSLNGVQLNAGDKIQFCADIGFEVFEVAV